MKPVSMRRESGKAAKEPDGHRRPLLNIERRAPTGTSVALLCHSNPGQTWLKKPIKQSGWSKKQLLDCTGATAAPDWVGGKKTGRHRPQKCLGVLQMKRSSQDVHVSGITWPRCPRFSPRARTGRFFGDKLNLHSKHAFLETFVGDLLV